MSGVEWQVHRLLHRYIAAVDAHDADAVAACFDDGGVLVVRGVERSGGEIVAFYREKLTVPTLHFVTGISVIERPDGVVAAGCGLFALEMADTGWSGVAGRYDDLIRIAEGDATFARRELTIDQRVRLTPDP